MLAGVPSRSARVWASRALKKAHVEAEIANVYAEIANKAQQSVAAETARVVASIADATERREILSRLARDPATKPGDTAKLVDVLNKMDGVYVQKHEHEVRTSLVDLLAPRVPA
jgi:phage terminase small subunit